MWLNGQNPRLAWLSREYSRTRYLPRYELHEVRDPNSLSIVVYDKWTGRVQRAVYDDKGAFKVMDVYTPF